jgi:hypothetical protein
MKMAGSKNLQTKKENLIRKGSVSGGRGLNPLDKYNLASKQTTMEGDLNHILAVHN